MLGKGITRPTSAARECGCSCELCLEFVVVDVECDDDDNDVKCQSL